jgi:signal transduction histidine kinase
MTTFESTPNGQESVGSARSSLIFDASTPGGRAAFCARLAQSKFTRLALAEPKTSKEPFVPEKTIVNPRKPGLTSDAEAPASQAAQSRSRRAESQLARLVQIWPGILFTQRADFSFEFLQGKIEEITGVPPAAWLGGEARFWDIIHEADVEELARQCREAAKTPGVVTTSYRVRHAATGKVSYILEHREAMFDPSGALLGYEGAWLDVTRQTIAEKRLAATAWKETLALLTMGLAHDFNNLMAGILSFSELLLAKAEPEAPQVRSLTMIKQSSLQASQLIQRIVNLHRSKTGVREYLDLNQIVPEVVQLICKVLPRHIRVDTQLTADRLPVYMDGVGFRQVLLNLALNAADAMPRGGALTLRLTAHTAPCELEHAHGKFPRLPCVCLSLQDNGSGIAARHLSHLFDPFFTTKPLTKGSGLGLYNARLFVEEHAGAISVESTEGEGATFHLWLPQADFTEAESFAAQNAQRRRSFLLVGQAGSATDAVAEFLRSHNFAIVATHSPARALELLAADEMPLHGVLVLAGPNDAALLGLVTELRERQLARRVVLQVLGGNPDDVDTRILEKASLVLPGNSEESVLLKRLENLCADSST